MYQIEFDPEALKDLKLLKKSEQKQIIEGIEGQLKYEPTVVTRHRKKRRPNPIAEWELRLGRFRVFYSVDEQASVVIIQAVGFKVGNLLFVRGKRKEP